MFQEKNCEEHPYFKKVFICIAENCSSGRLGCAKCIKEYHADHPKQCLFLEDLFQGEVQTVSQASEELTDKIKQLQRTLEDTGNQEERQVDEFLEDMSLNLIKVLELERGKLQDSYNQKKEGFISLLEELKKKVKEVYDICEIQKIVQQFQDNKISNEEGSKQITKFLKSEQRQEKKQHLKQIYERCQRELPIVCEEEIKHIKKQIQNNCEQIPDLVKVPGNWVFIGPTINNYNNNLVIKDSGRLIEFSNQESQQYVYGSNQMKYPHYYQWTIKIDGISASNYQTIYIGVVVDQFKEDMNNMFSYGKCVYLDLNNNAMTQYLTLRPQKKQLGVVIKDNTNKQKGTEIVFSWDSKNNLFTIQDSEEQSKYEYSKKQIKKQNNQMNIYNYQQHLSLFKSNNSLRPFIMNYGGSFKATLM